MLQCPKCLRRYGSAFGACPTHPHERLSRTDLVRLREPDGTERIVERADVRIGSNPR